MLAGRLGRAQDLARKSRPTRPRARGRRPGQALPSGMGTESARPGPAIDSVNCTNLEQKAGPIHEWGGRRRNQAATRSVLHTVCVAVEHDRPHPTDGWQSHSQYFTQYRIHMGLYSVHCGNCLPTSNLSLRLAAHMQCM